jgi:rhamnogalacturonyl hydrolase YesR
LVADAIADYILNKQVRAPDGAFYRVHTMWIDDLYMSTPFLGRYYKLTGKQEYIDDAARQFLLFKKYLFLPEYKIMSHIYDFGYNLPTGIPWGRGNGWCLFSLSEVLEMLPTDHPNRLALLDFFNELCEGYLALQGERGLWHQVLNEPDSYEETSCTAMFTYAFARGVRFGWLKEPAQYIKAVHRAWRGLTQISIDRLGNVHGVCRGSNYAFTSDYYKYELLWRTNDTHGIGIVMLAGVETLKLTEWLASR